LPWRSPGSLLWHRRFLPSYRLRSAAKGYAASCQFVGGKVIYLTQSTKQGAQQSDWEVKAEALPDFNTRPDPYLIQYVLLPGYDLDKHGEQTFTVYDIDAQGKGINHYEITLNLVDEDGVLLPNGKRPAKHFLQVQRTASNTWFKKQPGLGRAVDRISRHPAARGGESRPRRPAAGAEYRNPACPGIPPHGAGRPRAGITRIEEKDHVFRQARPPLRPGGVSSWYTVQYEQP
jgi:hypothetical protein